MQESRKTLEISPDVNWVGIKDWDREMFDRLISLPEGTTYNSYLILGEEKNTLIDTVNPGFESTLEKKIRQVIDLDEIDYIIMNHAEPDHANAIPHLLSQIKDCELLTSKKGKSMVQSLYQVPESKIRTVRNQETIDLGDKTLRFMRAQFVHWPETMMSFYEEEKILFPCDLFGCHLASEKFYDEEFGDELIDYAKAYYGEIMMPFSKMVRQALSKIENLEIGMIAPSHGPIYKNPETILEPYKKWSNGEVEKKVLIPYVSMWGSTEKMVETLAETIASEGVEVVTLDTATSNLEELARQIVDSSGIIIGTPTVLGGTHPRIQHIAYLTKKLNPPTKYLGIVESHGWSGGAVSQISEMLGKMDAEVVETIDVLGSPDEDNLEDIVEFGKEFANRIKK
ncbi:metallo-beta-lactamase [candidate division MSBL1 archaeon SCGC-AAA382F02]|uniref:Metallo-beta-lactamase n=1 Tax=candidate division MSBL1 archaeon SCGC-AAA382F02 TaxID=1698282 RepID=A0A133VIW6_9EURY|nr:metallo-beta-lactamase [candidate division MSBL1 archaeon SCGC-AAA382F02]